MGAARPNLGYFRSSVVLPCGAQGAGRTDLLPTPAGALHRAAPTASPILHLSLPFPSFSSLPAHPSQGPGAALKPPLRLRRLRVLGCLSSPEDDCGVGSRGALALKSKAEGRCLQAAPLDTSPVATSAPSVFETLQSRLSSLEATVAAWRRRSLSFPRPSEREDGDQVALEPFGDQEEGRPGQHEAARLRERNAWLRLALGSREDELLCTQASLQEAQAEKEILQRQVS